MDIEEAKAWLRGERSLANLIPQDPFETWNVRIAEADAAMTQQAYWIVKIHTEKDGRIPLLTEAGKRVLGKLDKSHYPVVAKDLPGRGYTCGNISWDSLVAAVETLRQLIGVLGEGTVIEAAPPVELSLKYKKDVKKALRAVKTGNAHHWPTIADILATEVKRLQEESKYV